ncbi:MAG: NADH-quinone oxidoreductase subunit L [Candidatus Omnitrophica bacterium]|nr:NADH-quinone oxidoreductase subunit L [Candidatus Omnitrophota bacterium]
MTLLLIPGLPLVSFVILIFFGRRLGRLSPWVSLLALAGSVFLSARLFVSSLHPFSPSAIHFSFLWLPLGGRPIRLGFLADPLSLTMCGVVTVVGWFIMLYSIGYMKGDPRFSRFFAYLSLFFASMLTLVLADHLLLLYIGWELVGLCSYLLIGFWFERPAAANACKKAFITTRIGDLGLLLAILLIAKTTGNLSLMNLSETASRLGPLAPVAALLIFWGAAGKSAQIPLHVWLPDAMEGPTPVSALIHAATMVAAGVYLVARTLPLFLPSPDALLVVAAVGGATSFFAATVACAQTDLKRILAYSTISQLGFMMLGLGCGSAGAGMFHLVTHAWFKALLFLGAGSVIHALHHQEVTRMGGLWKAMPVTALTFTLGAIAMAGIPPLSGFWSKEEIFTAAFGFSHPNLPWAGQALFGLASAVAFLTAFYITRAVLLTFAGPSRDPHAHPHESPAVMTVPLLVLAAGAAGVGLVGSPWLGQLFQHFLGAEAPHGARGPQWIAACSIAVAAAGMGLSLLRYGLGVRLSPGALAPAFSRARGFIFEAYRVDKFYQRVVIDPVTRLARAAFSFDGRVIDGLVNRTGQAGLWASRVKGWVDQTLVDGAVNGAAVTVGKTGAWLRLLQTGLVQNYLLIAAISTVALFLILKGV